MKTVDLMDIWSEPLAVTTWGGKCKPPISPAWGSYINMQTHPDDLIVFFRVIFPVFVVIEGCTLLFMNAEGHAEVNLIKFAHQAKSLEQFEKDFNNVKIYDLFSHAKVLHESSFELAAHLLKKSWEISLTESFPEKEFTVILSNTDKDYGPNLSFYTCRS